MFFGRRHNRSQETRRSRGEGGITLVELMVVITILGLLASIVGTAVFKKLKTARRATAMSQMRQFEQGIKFHKMEKRTLPESLDELFGEDGQLDGDSVPQDPWGNEYAYEKLSRSEYNIICYGADGVEGGEGEDEDITLDDLTKSADQGE